MLTKEELEAIKDRCEKATEGPWDVAFTTDGGWIIDSDGDIVSGTTPRDKDVSFIANARQDIPKLLNEIDLLQSEIRALRQTIRQREARG